jgi:hypothetical protein
LRSRGRSRPGVEQHRAQTELRCLLDLVLGAPQLRLGPREHHRPAHRDVGLDAFARRDALHLRDGVAHGCVLCDRGLPSVFTGEG